MSPVPSLQPTAAKKFSFRYLITGLGGLLLFFVPSQAWFVYTTHSSQTISGYTYSTTYNSSGGGDVSLNGFESFLFYVLAIAIIYFSLMGLRRVTRNGARWLLWLSIIGFVYTVIEIINYANISSQQSTLHSYSGYNLVAGYSSDMGPGMWQALAALLLTLLASIFVIVKARRASV